jgi:hypothetical protein
MPFYRTEFDSRLSPPEVAERLRGLMRPKRRFWENLFTTAEERQRWPFRGRVGEGTFKFIRLLGYRNSFVPIIRGTYSSGSMGGTTVRLTMTMYAAVWIVVLVWIACCVSLLKTHGITDLTTNLMIAFIVIVPAALFFTEAIKARNMLMRALDGKKRRAESPPLH